MFAGGRNNDSSFLENNSEKYMAYDKIKQNLNNLKSKPLEKVKYTLYVYDKSGPITQARVFGGRNTTQTIKNYGVTNAKGELSVELNPYLKPDVLIFKKDGFQIGRAHV